MKTFIVLIVMAFAFAFAPNAFAQKGDPAPVMTVEGNITKVTFQALPFINGGANLTKVIDGKTVDYIEVTNITNWPEKTDAIFDAASMQYVGYFNRAIKKTVELSVMFASEGPYNKYSPTDGINNGSIVKSANTPDNGKTGENLGYHHLVTPTQ